MPFLLVSMTGHHHRRPYWSGGGGGGDRPVMDSKHGKGLLGRDRRFYFGHSFNSGIYCFVYSGFSIDSGYYNVVGKEISGIVRCMLEIPPRYLQ